MEKIKQIIPAEGWSAEYTSDDIPSRVVTCWAIVEDEYDEGEVQIRGYGADSDGSLVDLGKDLDFERFSRTDDVGHRRGYCRLLEVYPCHGNWFVITKNSSGEIHRRPVTAWGKYEEQNEPTDHGDSDAIFSVVGMTMRYDGLQRIDHFGPDIIGYERDEIFVDKLQIDVESKQEKWEPILNSRKDLLK